MPHATLVWLLCWLLTASPALATSFQLVTNGDEPLYQTTLDLAVYEQSHRDHLQDLIIRNAAGESLPYALLPYTSMHPQKHGQTMQALDVTSAAQADLKKAGIQQIPRDKIIDPAAVNANKPASTTNPAYLIDAGEQHAPLLTLKATWQGSQNKLVAIEIFSSNDLNDWLKIGDAVLLSADHDGQKILRDTITLNALTSARYLQIKPHHVLPGDAFQLTGINAVYHSKIRTDLPILWQPATLINHLADSKNALITLNFKAPSHITTSYLRIQLAQQDSISYVNVSARKTRHAVWVPLAQAPIYHLVKNGHFKIVNPDIMISPTNARYWQLTFNQPKNALNTQKPSLQLGWLPDTLLWHARGKPPYTLEIAMKSALVNANHPRYTMPDYASDTLQNIPKAALRYDPNQPQQHAWLMILYHHQWWFLGSAVLGVLMLAGLVYWLVKSNQSSP